MDRALYASHQLCAPSDCDDDATFGAKSLPASLIKAGIRESSFPMLLHRSKFKLKLAAIEPYVVDVAGRIAGRNSATPSVGEVAVVHPGT
ncbi:hypothetical protein MFM001_32010 [Mycobacterium sp. MFM001]|nr:hypothetical protein MFM001_32010 [Mycobacterium sp. MFM001]